MLKDTFIEINPEMLDNWFFDMIEKYRDSQIEKHLQVVYSMLTNSNKDNLANYHDEKGWN